MKHLFIIFSLFFAFGTTIIAQNIKFGKPTNEEWELKSVSFAPEADAVVLYKSVDVSYTPRRLQCLRQRWRGFA